MNPIETDTGLDTHHGAGLVTKRIPGGWLAQIYPTNPDGTADMTKKSLAAVALPPTSEAPDAPRGGSRADSPLLGKQNHVDVIEAALADAKNLQEKLDHLHRTVPDCPSPWAILPITCDLAYALGRASARLEMNA